MTPLLMSTEQILEVANWAEAIANWEFDPVDPPACVVCHDDFTLETGYEPTPVCHVCAQRLAAEIPILMSHISALTLRVLSTAASRDHAEQRVVEVMRQRDNVISDRVKDANALVEAKYADALKLNRSQIVGAVVEWLRSDDSRSVISSTNEAYAAARVIEQSFIGKAM